MKLLATVVDASTNMIPVQTVSQKSGKLTAPFWSFWQSIAKGFWAYTEESGKSETKSFEGLL